MSVANSWAQLCCQPKPTSRWTWPECLGNPHRGHSGELICPIQSEAGGLGWLCRSPGVGPHGGESPARNRNGCAGGDPDRGPSDNKQFQHAPAYAVAALRDSRVIGISPQLLANAEPESYM